MDTTYKPPLALTILSAIFLLLGAICFAIIAVDIVIRKGWRSMMWIMIPVYPINAAYMLPLELYIYFRFGRAKKPTESKPAPASHCHSKQAADTNSHALESSDGQAAHHACHKPSEADTETPPTEPCSHGSSASDPEKGESAPQNSSDMSRCHHHDTSRPMWATVLVGVSHCGAGCVLGDLVGEWLVFGTHATISGQMIWVELLVDYTFALLFGIAFQYFSIAPMSGEYGPKTVWRAFKADVISLTSFEIGAFGWMVIYQVGIFGYRLSMTTWTYWWMMQIGMALGFATAFPVNWILLSKGIKEPCC